MFRTSWNRHVQGENLTNFRACTVDSGICYFDEGTGHFLK